MQHTTLKVNGGGRGGSEAARGPDDVGGQGGGGGSETVRGPKAVGVLMMWGDKGWGGGGL